MSRRHRYMAALLGAAAALGLGSQEARAAGNAFLQLTGASQGQIRGDSTRVQYPNHIEVNEIHHLVRQDSGSGRVVHEPFIFTKQVDRSTVNLFRALDTGESLTAVFKYERTDQTGQSQQYYTVTLLNAVIVAIEPIKGDTFDSVQSQFPDRERVRMIYQRIRIEFPSDGNESHELIAQ